MVYARTPSGAQRNVRPQQLRLSLRQIRPWQHCIGRTALPPNHRLKYKPCPRPGCVVGRFWMLRGTEPCGTHAHAHARRKVASWAHHVGKGSSCPYHTGQRVGDVASAAANTRVAMHGRIESLSRHLETLQLSVSTYTAAMPALSSHAACVHVRRTAHADGFTAPHHDHCTCSPMLGMGSRGRWSERVVRVAAVGGHVHGSHASIVQPRGGRAGF